MRALFNHHGKVNVLHSQGHRFQVPFGSGGQLARLALELVIKKNEVGRLGVGLLSLPENVVHGSQRERAVKTGGELSFLATE